ATRCWFYRNFFVYLQKPQYIVKMESIGERIKQRRKMLNITQEQLADIAEVGINTLTKIERDEGNPTLKVLLKVLDTLGLEIKITIKTMNQ
ncbi:helix-turn-helix domain-containing protein, partial [uncultured Muribaculum sp.]|uniref:helix-turn-helix domain-containing protein n=1 Tax=uncultured Muribaculum sp. TaxID=1918613 RepID=UPI00351A8A07